MSIINKISVRSVYGDKKKIRKAAEAAKGEPVTVMRVVGIARGFETGEGDNGPWVKFKGNFQGTAVDTGELFKSGKLFLPGVASDLLEAELMNDEVTNVELAFDIHAVEDDTSAVGYVYTVTPLIEVGENDPIMALVSSLPELPKIAAPKKKTTKETAEA